MLDFSKIFEDKSVSVFENMDKLMSLITEAEGDEEETTEEEDTEGGDEAPAEGDAPAADAAPPAPEQNQEIEQDTPTDEIAEEEDGIYVSANEKAVLAKTMLDALLCTPPSPGEIPAEFLSVTNSNADQVISLIQSYLAITSNKDLTDTNSDENLVGELKDIS